MLEEHFTVSSLTSKENLQLTSLAVSGCIELPCSGGKVSKNCLAEKSPVHSPQVQVSKNGLRTVLCCPFYLLHRVIEEEYQTCATLDVLVI